MSQLEFRRLSELIASQFGISIAPSKRTMVETRLRKRARLLQMNSLSDYFRYLHSASGKSLEWTHFVDVITTHKTDFFREPVHFQYLVEHVVPGLADSGVGTQRPLQVWSSACSTGEEPYTVAMVLSAVAESEGIQRYSFRIYATDISAGVLETARDGVYPESSISPVPQSLRQRYLLRSKDPERAVVRMNPEIRSRVDFRQLNLMDAEYRFDQPFDVVFCRDVLIYFDRLELKEAGAETMA